MPSDGTSSCTAVVPAGSGDGVGVAVGSLDGSALAAAADSDGVADASATAEPDGSTMGGRLLVGPPSAPREPMMMRVIPTTPRMVGSPHATRRFT